MTPEQLDDAMRQCFNNTRHTRFIVTNATDSLRRFAMALEMVELPVEWFRQAVTTSNYAINPIPISAGYPLILHEELARETAAYFNHHGMRRPERIPYRLKPRPAARRQYGYSPVLRARNKRRLAVQRIRA